MEKKEKPTNEDKPLHKQNVHDMKTRLQTI